MNESEIAFKINRIRNLLNDLEKSLTDNISDELLMSPDKYSALKNLLFSDEWPKAVEEEMICDETSDVDKTSRAQGMLETIISDPLDGKRALDFGTGEGHVVREMVKKGADYAMGFDIAGNFIKKDPKMEFATDWKIVQNHGPYDIIICCDVLDHLVNSDPVEALKKMKSVLTPEGRIYLRRHNYMSRHGAHLYKQLNKAFIHLIFTESELHDLIPDLKLMPTYKVYFPIKTYNDQIQNSKLNIDFEFKTTTPVESIFERNEFLERIYTNTPFKHFPRNQLELDFVDYTLKH